MTSFCRRVIAMRRIVANKKRIASVFAKASELDLLTDLIPTGEVAGIVTALKVRCSTVE